MFKGTLILLCSFSQVQDRVQIAVDDVEFSDLYWIVLGDELFKIQRRRWLELPAKIVWHDFLCYETSYAFGRNAKRSVQEPLSFSRQLASNGGFGTFRNGGAISDTILLIIRFAAAEAPVTASVDASLYLR
jgi:hypothetical protein